MELLLPQCLGRIRPVSLSDAAACLPLAQNPLVPRYMTDRFPHPYHESDAVDFLTMAEQCDPAQFFAIEVEGKFAGGISYEPLDDVGRITAEIGYWLGEPYWGRGIASEAATVFSDWLLGTGRFVRLQAGVFHPNLASARVLEKAGFTLEGRMKRAVIKNGVIHDRLMYAKLADV